MSFEALSPETFDSLAPGVFPRELSGPEAPVWLEAWAGWLQAHDRGPESTLALEQAASLALGVQRLVLLRRLADVHLHESKPELTLEILRPVGRSPAPLSELPRSTAGAVLASRSRPLLDRWEQLTSELALTAVELTRAEALSHLVKKDDTVRAFEELGKKLAQLSGAPAPGAPNLKATLFAPPSSRPNALSSLWLRWAKSWCWFLCEILGRPTEAMKVCELARARVPPEALKTDEFALGFVRAQEMACSSLGDFTRALALAEEHLSLAQERGDLREQCLGWNARAILHFGEGQLPEARAAFEQSLQLAVTARWARREAIATHNLALVLCELGELDAAREAEHRYARLSLAIGNHAATAEAPLLLASVALAGFDLADAETQLTRARKAAETNGWAVLVAQARAVQGRLRLVSYVRRKDSLELTRARSDLAAALDFLEESSVAWTEELDPGELYALAATANALGGNHKDAMATLSRGEQRVPVQNVVSRATLSLGRAFVEKRDFSSALGWFSHRRFSRTVVLWTALSSVSPESRPSAGRPP